MMCCLNQFGGYLVESLKWDLRLDSCPEFGGGVFLLRTDSILGVVRGGGATPNVV